MSRITVPLPDHLLNRVNEAARNSGVSRRVLVARALDDYLFFCRFPEIRRIATDQARERGLVGDEVYDLTEEEIIELRDRLIRGIEAMAGCGIVDVFHDHLPPLPVHPLRRVMTRRSRSTARVRT
jgi:predicted transcriptional regulator